MKVATVTIGHSRYDDDVYQWINSNLTPSPEMATRYALMGVDYLDCMEAWPILILVGCDITNYGLAPEHAPPYQDPLVTITFGGSKETLMKRLNSLK